MGAQTNASGSADSREMLRELNLGCGPRRRAECFNVDRATRVEPDLVWDLDQYPYPPPESHFRRIYATDVVEHLENIPRFMEEVYRLLQANGEIEITTPHFSCANSYTDPTHRHHLGYFSFDYFTADSELNFYAVVRFEVVSRQIVFQRSLLNGAVSRLANWSPGAYEQRFSWMLPAWFLIFKLRAVK